MVLGTLEDIFKSEMLFSLSRLSSKSIILFSDQVAQCYHPCNCVSYYVMLSIWFYLLKRFNLSDIWSQISIGNCIFPFSNNINFPIRRAGESEWLLEPALQPVTWVRSPALAPGGPSVGLPCEISPLYFILCQFTGIQLLLCAFCNVKALLDKI